MISNNFKETKRVFFGHTLRTLLNSDHIMPSDINSLLKSKGIISPSSDKKETVPLLSALILSPSELNSLLEKTISHEKNPKHRTSNLALSKPNSAWMREIQRVNLTPLVTQLQNEFTNIAVGSAYGFECAVIFNAVNGSRVEGESNDDDGSSGNDE